MSQKVVVFTVSSVVALGGLIAFGCSDDTNPNPSASSSGGTSSGNTTSGGTSSGTSGYTTSGGTSGNTSSGGHDAGGDAADDSGNSGRISAACSAYCTCMTTRCADTVVGSGNCGQECMANETKWDLSCRTMHCGYSPNPPETPSALHCGHAVAKAGCPNK